MNTPKDTASRATWWRYLAYLYESHAEIVCNDGDGATPIGFCDALPEIIGDDTIGAACLDDLEIFRADLPSVSVYWWGDSFEERAFACAWIATLLDAGETLRGMEWCSS